MAPTNKPIPAHGEFKLVAQIARDHAERLRRYLRRRLRREHEAEDLAQEVYLRMLRMPQERQLQNPLAYTMVIAANVLSDYRLTGSQRIADRGVALDAEDLELNGSREEIPDAIAERVNLAQQLDRAIRQLPDIEQVVLLLTKRDGWTFEQVAQRLDISTHMVHHYLKRAKSRLRAFAWDR